nr:MAG TPA: hypothetical protein [Caudoviricetes sp.]
MTVITLYHTMYDKSIFFYKKSIKIQKTKGAFNIFATFSFFLVIKRSNNG